MNYESAINIFDTLGDDDKAKEIYAHFGLAVYMAQVIEQQSINMIAICRQIKNKSQTQEKVDSLWDDYNLGSRTLGVLTNEIKQLYKLTEQDSIELGEVLKLRNYIAHDYFRFNSELFFSDSGQKRMIKDFIEFQAKAKSLDSKLVSYMNIYTTKIGLTDDKIQDIYKQTKNEWQQKIIADNYKTIIK